MKQYEVLGSISGLTKADNSQKLVKTLQKCIKSFKLTDLNFELAVTKLTKHGHEATPDLELAPSLPKPTKKKTTKKFIKKTKISKKKSTKILVKRTTKKAKSKHRGA
jgi:hypothetical protein